MISPATALASAPMELWGGVECTITRIRNDFRDQCRQTGHRDRLGDLDRIASLGIKTLRYPVLMEQVSPDDPDEADWRWHDERLGRLRELGIRVIATLCHHGGGPRYTNLLDPQFPEHLACHAARVAERYPWIDLYTPVNEPLTTARFCALYGHWYPHARDDRSFLRALLAECRATVLAMRAIRGIRSDAQLLQTEDLGKTFSTPKLAYQAEYENERRWLSFDLLCGNVDPGHFFWSTLVEQGASPEELSFSHAADATPDLLGINHYLTSDRFLDDQPGGYPDESRGGNGREVYADLEAVRINLPAAELGPAARLREAWARYGKPIVVAEAHHGCTRDEQLRWLTEVWKAAAMVKAEGADMRAVTVWALFGTVDWNTLLTQTNHVYENGAFDTRGPEPRPTAIAHACASLAAGGDYDHPVIDGAGWWRREGRFYRMPTAGPNPRWTRPARKLLVTGRGGTLGRAFSRLADHRGLAHVLTGRGDMNIADQASVEAALDLHKPWAVVNTAGFVRVADAEKERGRCMRENFEGARNLAEACGHRGIPLVTFSSDLVFDGRLGRSFVESDALSPGGVYGESKALAEAAVLAAHPAALIVRTSAFFGPWDRHNFAFAVLRALAAGLRFEADPHIVSPTYVPDLVHVALDLLIDGERGIWHLASPGASSWASFARSLARQAGLDPSLVVERRASGEPVNTSLTSERGVLLPPIGTAIERYIRDCEVEWTNRSEALIAAQ